MALIDKLKEKQEVVKTEETSFYQVEREQKFKELEALMKETKELNGLMKAYIQVHMDKDGTSQMTIDHELRKIKMTSQEVQEKMVSILTRLEDTQKDYANQLLNHMANGRNEMSNNNQKTLQKMSEIEEMLNRSMSEMSKKMNQNMNEIENRTSGLIAKVRKNVLFNYWLDVAKYGLGTAIFVVPLFYLVRFIFSLFGVELP